MKYYIKEKEQVLKELSSCESGISEKEAESRLLKNGFNKIDDGQKKTLFSRFLSQLKDVMIIVLIIAAILSFVVSIYEGESFADALIIIFVVLLNICLGIFQELKADKAIEALQNLNAPLIKVVRDNEIKTIKTEELTLGDIVMLEAGDFVPADGRVVESHSMKISESALTGESEAVLKTSEALSDGNYSLGDRVNMVYSGCNVVYGRGKVVVTNVGMNTELGKIASVISSMKEEETPLQVQMKNLSKTLSVIIVFLAIVMFLIGLYQGENLIDIFMLSVALCVAAIPEGLAAVITVCLAIGVQNMSKKNSIIRKLSAVEALGCTEIICTDKTGTLTQNKMTVVKTYFDQNDATSASDKLFLAMILCNDSNISGKEVLGDPTETALINYFKLSEVNETILKHSRVNEIPFDSNRKMMSTVNRFNDEYLMFTKGSFESVLLSCSKILLDGKIVKLTKKYSDELVEANKNLSSEALRVLAFSYKPVKKDESVDEKDLIFIGLAAMIDPPRKEVKKAVQNCFKAGITPVMITGDNLNTAIAIAKDIGIYKDGNLAITGLEVDDLTDEELESKINDIRVYARVSPENKMRIVKTFQKIGKTVAMSGDGVNDAPALKGADIAVGMGITGTEVTKNVSSMVLADDNFATIVDAVGEGRRIYSNIQNAITYLLASNLCEVFIIFFGMFALSDGHILLPVQILWINLISDTIPAIALAFEKADSNIMEKKPRKKSEPFFTKFTSLRIIVAAIIKTVFLSGMFLLLSAMHGESTAASCVFIVLAITEILFAFSCRSDSKSILEIGVFTNKNMFICVSGTIILQILVLSNSYTRSLLGVEQFDGSIYFLITAVIILLFLFLEINKVVLAKIFKKD